MTYIYTCYMTYIYVLYDRVNFNETRNIDSLELQNTRVVVR